MSRKDVKPQSFQFVPVAGSGAVDDEVAKAQQRRLIRSNAANFQWSHQRKRERKGSSQSARKEGRVTSPSSSVSPTDGRISIGSKSESLSPGRIENAFPKSVLGTKLELELDEFTLTALASLIRPSDGILPTSLLDILSMLSPQDQVHNLMKFNAELMFSNLLPEVSKQVQHPALERLVRVILSTPSLYQMGIHCVAVYHHSLKGRGPEDEGLLLSTHTQAIHLLNDEIRDPEKACIDENLLFVLCLALHGWSQSVVEVQPSPHQGPLRDLQSLQSYSLMKLVAEHVDGLAMLVEMRGSLEEVRLGGLAALISYCGLMEASSCLKKPRWPFMPLRSSFTPLESMNSPAPANHPLAGLAVGFPLEINIWDSLHEIGLFSVLQEMGAYTIILHDHCEGGPDFDDSLAAIADQRNFIHHKIMSLPENTTGELGLVDNGLYEVTRLAAIIFSLLVIFPIAPAAAPFVELATRLREALSQIDTRNLSIETLKYLVWVVSLGGIAATGSAERAWFVSMLAKLSGTTELYEWPMLRELLMSFLWLPSAGDWDAMALWVESRAVTL